jgi:hypothetical protein
MAPLSRFFRTEPRADRSVPGVGNFDERKWGFSMRVDSWELAGEESGRLEDLREARNRPLSRENKRGGRSSVGQSGGLIIRWSLVRVQPAPRRRNRRPQAVFRAFKGGPGCAENRPWSPPGHYPDRVVSGRQRISAGSSLSAMLAVEADRSERASDGTMASAFAVDCEPQVEHCAHNAIWPSP